MKHEILRKFRPSGAGFTILELLVSLAIFGVVISLVVGIAVSGIRAQRRALSFQSTIDNVRFSMEVMVRAIRQSTLVDWDANFITIDHPTKGTIRYELSGGRITEDGVPLTGSEVSVERFDVSVLGAVEGDSQQSRVVVSLGLETPGVKTEEQSSMDVQSTVSLRVRD